MPILPTLHGPADLRDLTEAQLEELATEIRETIIATVASTGGHLGSSLGVVELTIALHRLLESPRDRIVWDTGHQAYPHKLLTGRYERFGTLRQIGGVGGFPRRSESEHDVFDGGHAGTGLSIGQGLATARDLRRGDEADRGRRRRRGDHERPQPRGAQRHRPAEDAAADRPQRQRDVDQPDGRRAVLVPEHDQAVRHVAVEQTEVRRAGRANSLCRTTVRELSQRLRHSVLTFAQAGRLFEDLGITYIGLVPGHDMKELLSTFSRALELPGPVIVHVRTQKGRGFEPAEADQIGFHGAALPPMSIPAVANGNGTGAMPTESMTDDAAPPTAASKPKAKNPNYTAVFVAELIELARKDLRIVGITAGMPTGTGLSKFQAEFPERFVDVGIAEQHSVALATGLAMGGMRPVVALYSTFLQRAFDQTVHDVCQNDQPVLLAVDRAGLVGEDGTSHQGMFTLPAQRQLPNLVIASPKDEQELRSLLVTALVAGPPVRAPLPARRGLWPAEGQAGRACRSGRARSCARGATCCSSDSGRSWRGRSKRPSCWRRTAGRSASSMPGSRSRSTPSSSSSRRAASASWSRSRRASSPVGSGRACSRRSRWRGLTDAALRDVPVRIIGIPGDRFVDHGSVERPAEAAPARLGGARGAGPRDAERDGRRSCRSGHGVRSRLTPVQSTGDPR